MGIYSTYSRGKSCIVDKTPIGENMTIDWSLFLEYLKVVISWPVAVLIIAVFLSRKFKPEVGDWFRYLVIKRGELEVSSRQPSSMDEPADEFLPSTEIVEDVVIDLAGETVGRSDAVGTLSVEEADEDPTAKIDILMQTIETQKGVVKLIERQALYWEFQYLNYFLVQNSKRVLAWFSTFQSPMTLVDFHAKWTPYIFMHTERQSILNALVARGLLEIQDNLVSITTKGREYVGWANLSTFLKT